MFFVFCTEVDSTYINTEDIDDLYISQNMRPKAKVRKELYIKIFILREDGLNGNYCRVVLQD
jgi:hypothetical protein